MDWWRWDYTWALGSLGAECWTLGWFSKWGCSQWLFEISLRIGGLSESCRPPCTSDLPGIVQRLWHFGQHLYPDVHFECATQGDTFKNYLCFDFSKCEDSLTHSDVGFRFHLLATLLSDFFITHSSRISTISGTINTSPLTYLYFLNSRKPIGLRDILMVSPVLSVVARCWLELKLADIDDTKEDICERMWTWKKKSVCEQRSWKRADFEDIVVSKMLCFLDIRLVVIYVNFLFESRWRAELFSCLR